MLLIVRWWLRVVRCACCVSCVLRIAFCLMCVVRCALFDIGSLMFVVFICCLLFVDDDLLCVVCGVLCVLCFVCCALCVL